MDEILNRVAASKLEVFDLEDYYPNGNRIKVDLSQWLEEGFILREKDFRERLRSHDWTQYQDAFVAVGCSTGAILPAWATILVTIYLTPFARKIVGGSLEDIDSELYREILPALDYAAYRDKPVIIKGCAQKPVPESAYLLAAQLLAPVAKSIMYGEACSAVPLYKKK